MKKISIFLLLIFISFSYGQIPNGYYDNAQGLSGYQLKTALKNIITNGHNPHSYGDLYNAYETTDTDYYYENDGTVLDMYSENPNGTDPYNYNHHQNTCGQYVHEGDCYNREHLMPQSLFGSAMPMKSDVHFVVPSDGKVNGMRSSYPFGEVNNPIWTSQNGSKLGPNTVYGYSGTVFEPIDEFKGDIARMLFYVATRYEDQISGWSSSDMLDGSSDRVFTGWFLQVLLDWAAQDPVSQREIDRNNAAYNYQGNRNPFIDHPEWVNAIWDPGSSVQYHQNVYLTLYPVPVHTGQQKLYIACQNAEIKNMTLLDVSGKEITLDYTQNQKFIEVDRLSVGMYFLQIETSQGQQVKEFIVE